MKTIKTISCKLEVGKQERQALLETIAYFIRACNDALSIAREQKEWNRYKLHGLCYYALRKRYPLLVANYICRAIARVCAKRQRRPKSFQNNSLDLDKDLFRFIEADEKISLSTAKGRLKIKLSLGNFQRGLLGGQKPTAATLVYKKSKKVFYVNFVLKKEISVPFGNNPIGVDRGLYNLATTSNGLKFSGRQAMHIRKRYANLRRVLQIKGTKGTKRLLKQLSGREARWMKNLNHLISRRIVDSCKDGDVIVLENLKHIREQIRLRKKQRGNFHSWAFAQLDNFIEYKALEKGIPVVHINPHYTSQKCPRCGGVSKYNRNTHRFSCKVCNFTKHADFVAALNIAEVFRALGDGFRQQTPKQPSLKPKLNFQN